MSRSCTEKKCTKKRATHMQNFLLFDVVLVAIAVVVAKATQCYRCV